MEISILNSLDWKLSHCTVEEFLCVLLRIANIQHIYPALLDNCRETSINCQSLYSCRASVQAAAILFILNEVNELGISNQTLAVVLNNLYTTEEIVSIFID